MKNTIVALVYDFDETLLHDLYAGLRADSGARDEPEDVLEKGPTSGRSTTAPTRLRAACTIL